MLTSLPIIIVEHYDVIYNTSIMKTYNRYEILLIFNMKKRKTFDYCKLFKITFYIVYIIIVHSVIEMILI